MSMTRLCRTLAGLLAASSLALHGCSGEDGDRGPAGPQGPAGEDGADGTDGENGNDGNNGTDGPQGPAGPGAKWLSFGDVGFARTNAEKHRIRSVSRANVNGTEVEIGFRPLVRSRQDPSRPNRACDLAASPSTCVGALLAASGQPARDDAGAPIVSNYHDFSSLLDVAGNKFLVQSFEQNPAAIYVTRLDQDAAGVLTATASQAIDASSVDGLFRTCAGSITPWGTHISSEEAQLDARITDGATTWPGLVTALNANDRVEDIKGMGRYFGFSFADTNMDGQPDGLDFAALKAAVSAYYYGYAVEVVLAASGAPTVTKHYAMGRLGQELAYVMPDRRTVFLTDDVTNGGLFMFVADTAGDLGAGTLYAMRAYQTTSVGSSFTADIEWINLGHATNAEVRALLHPATGTRKVFDDLFETAALNPDNTCPMGFAAVRANGANTTLECLKVKPGMDLAASRLETRRYAVVRGATAELTKEEGLTYDPDLKRLYIALANINASMGSQTGGTDHINVAPNACGGVFALDVGPIYDDAGAKITEYAAMNWYPLVMGRPTVYPAGSPYASESCSITGLASPDNVTYLPGYQTLVIGEDTDGHTNDVLWAYHMPSGRMTRLLTSPYGAEVTSPYWVPKLGNFGYLLSAVQHPYTEGPGAGRANDPEATGRDSTIGVFGPFPALN
jgi:uncharacterized protein